MTIFQNQPATDNQVKFIHDLCVELCIDITNRKSMLELRFKTEYADKLSKQQASSFLQELLVMREELKEARRFNGNDEDE